MTYNCVSDPQELASPGYDWSNLQGHHYAVPLVMLDRGAGRMDEAHSLILREKGLAGMVQNVRQGWRSGLITWAGRSLRRLRSAGSGVPSSGIDKCGPGGRS